MSNITVVNLPENGSQKNTGTATGRRGNNVSEVGKSPLNPEPNDATQVFIDLKQECLSKQVLFEDPKFPAADSSLFPNGMPAEKFIGNIEIVEYPKFFVNGASRFDAKQSKFLNCWVIAGLSSLAMHPKLLYQVVPKDQSFQEHYAGIFHFRFWRYGKWVDVVIDDRLPMDSQGLVCARSSESNEFWTSLVMKAYAKLYGSWEAIENGQASEAFEDFTGGISMYYALSDPRYPTKFLTFLQAQKQRALIACQSKSNDRSSLACRYGNIDLLGIVQNHVYNVTGVHNYNGYELLRMRNPLGNQIEWRGPFGDTADVWTDRNIRKALDFKAADDGEFFIPFNRISTHFHLAHICYPDLQGVIKRGCHVVSFEGKWIRRTPSAQGNDTMGISAEIRSQNQQFFITVKHSNDLDGKRALFIAVMQKNRRMNRAPNLRIGFELYRVKDVDQSSTPLGIDFFKRNKRVPGSGSGLSLREVYDSYRLKPGVYCIIPSIYTILDGTETLICDEEEEFLLRVMIED